MKAEQAEIKRIAKMMMTGIDGGVIAAMKSAIARYESSFSSEEVSTGAAHPKTRETP